MLLTLVQHNAPLGEYYREERETERGKENKKKRILFFPSWAAMVQEGAQGLPWHEVPEPLWATHIMDNENLALVIKMRYTTAGQFKIYFRSVLSGTLRANITSFKDSY